MSASGAQGPQGALLRRRIEALRLEERLRAAEELQDDLAAEGRVPDTRRLMLRRFAPLFARDGAVGFSAWSRSRIS